ncbi:MAG: hypothetical protein WCC30_06520 [Candidatus Dormiibacterota bacterium]
MIKRKFTPAQLEAAYEETARIYAACLAHGDHDFRFVKIVPNGDGFRSILPSDAFAELHACGFIAISACSRCNAFSMVPLGQDMPVMP